ncbi:MAG: NnrU family protein [Thioalkalispiraceae bacterium]|jgi:protein-S-isoprenylcysteine O-methyltransferase Ste14
MQTSNLYSYLLLAFVTIAWCALHSAMITPAFTRFLEKLTGRYYRYYRLLFNLVAILTLIPVILYHHSLITTPLFDWNGHWRILQVIFIALGILLFLLGAKKYDAKRFIGITQLKEKNTRQGLTTELDTSGVHALVRHPWYTGLILLLWARPVDTSTIIINTILTLYLIIGSLLEERKLIMEFGNKYREYQHSVSMLFPLKWIHSKLKRDVH